MLEFLGVALRIITLPLVIPIKALGVALRYLGDAVGAVLSPFESLWNVMTGTADAADWLTVALLAIPDDGLIVWALDAAGALDMLLSPLDAAAQAGDDLSSALGGLGDVAMAILSPFDSIQNIMDGTASSADWLTAALLAIPGGEIVAWAVDAAGSVDEIAAAFERAMQAGQAFLSWLDPRGEGQSWGDWLNPLSDSGSSGGESGDGTSAGGSGPGPGPGRAPGITTSADQTAAATGSSSGPPSSGGSGNVDVAHSPIFNVDLGLESLADLGDLGDEIGEMTDRAIEDLKREIETQFFRFETGQ